MSSAFLIGMQKTQHEKAKAFSAVWNALTQVTSFLKVAMIAFGIILKLFFEKMEACAPLIRPIVRRFWSALE